MTYTQTKPQAKPHETCETCMNFRPSLTGDQCKAISRMDKGGMKVLGSTKRNDGACTKFLFNENLLKAYVTVTHKEIDQEATDLEGWTMLKVTDHEIWVQNNRYIDAQVAAWGKLNYPEAQVSAVFDSGNDEF